jgi:hypothetical protein
MAMMLDLTARVVNLTPGERDQVSVRAAALMIWDVVRHVRHSADDGPTKTHIRIKVCAGNVSTSNRF